MEIFKKIAIAALALAGSTAQAQVQFKIERMHNSTYFKISAVPEVDYAAPMNTVATAQVTLKVPTGKFKIPEIVNISPDGQWQLNGRADAPKEAPEFDYLYYGLKNLGSRAFKFSKDKETPLFMLKAGDHCEGKIQLVNNLADPFFGKNSMAANIGNQITILGAGGDAWAGNRDGGECDCFVEPHPEVEAGEIVIYPNPVNGPEVKFGFTKDEKDKTECEVILYDITGRRVYFEKIQPKTGYNEYKLNVSQYPIGIYQMEIRGLKLRSMYQQIVKTD